MKALWAACGTGGIVILLGSLIAAIVAFWGDQVVTIEEMETFMSPVLVALSFLVVVYLMATWGGKPQKKGRKPHVRPHRGGF